MTSLLRQRLRLAGAFASARRVGCASSASVEAQVPEGNARERQRLLPIAAHLLERIQQVCAPIPGFVFATQRVKDVDSFVRKSKKSEKTASPANEEPRYPDPLTDIHDQIGCRVVVRGIRYVEPIRRLLQDRFDALEIDAKRPEHPGLFGYAALHMECPIPDGLRGRTNPVQTTRFEVQIA